MRASRATAVVIAVFAAGALLRAFFLLSYRPAFLGIADSGSYMAAASRGLFDNVYDPAGYPLFLRLWHALYPHLSLLTLVQHGLGLASAALFYLLVRRVTGSPCLGLAPAVVLLFDGYGIWVEHSPLSETLFVFLVAAAMFLAARVVDLRSRALLPLGALAGAAGVVRPAGFVLAGVLVVWVALIRTGRVRARLLAALAVLAPAAAIGLGYALVQNAETGVMGLNRDAGRVLYARVAKFADCSRFTPPPGTRGLCESTPSSARGSFNQYLTGYPDAWTNAPRNDRTISPAWRLFGPPPGGDSKLAAFGRAAIRHQPLDYLEAVVHDFHFFWTDSHRAFIEAAERPSADIERIVAGYYDTGPGVHSANLGVLRWYGLNVNIRGPLVILLLLAPLLGLVASLPSQRRVVALLAATGWLLPLGSVAAASVDPRFILPAYGPLAAAGAIGLSGVRLRRPAWLRARRAAGLRA